MGSSEFTNLKEVIEESINSFTFTRGEWPKPSESKLYKVLQGGVILHKNGEVGYVLALRKKEDFPKRSYYVEAVFPNPVSPQKPIVVSKEIFKDDKDLGFQFSSPPIKGITAFKRYSITVNTYESGDKKEVIDTLTQEIISFANVSD